MHTLTILMKYKIYQDKNLKNYKNYDEVIYKLMLIYYY